MDKAQMIGKLREMFARWEVLLDGLSGEQITAPNFADRLSIKDILAHLAVWEKITLARMEAARNGREPDYPAWPVEEIDPDTDEDLNRINAWIYEGNRERSWEDIRDEWRERSRRIVGLAEAVTEDELLEAGRYAWLEGYALLAVLEGSFEHHEEHLEGLTALLAAHGNKAGGGDD